MSALYDEPGTILEWTTSAGQGNETGASVHSKKKGGVDTPPFAILIGCRNQKPTLTPTMNACPVSSWSVPSPSYSTSWYDVTSFRPGPRV